MFGIRGRVEWWEAEDDFLAVTNIPRIQIFQTSILKIKQIQPKLNP